jgi:hypothetical protein
MDLVAFNGIDIVAFEEREEPRIPSTDQDCFAWLGWVPWCCGFSVAAGAIGASVKLRKIGPKGFAGLAGD